MGMNLYDKPIGGALSSEHASSRIGGMAGRHVRRRWREGTHRRRAARDGRRGRRLVRRQPQGGGAGGNSAAGCLIVPMEWPSASLSHGDPRGGAAHGLRARDEPLLSHGGVEARRASHGGGRQGRGDGRAGVRRTARGGRRRHAHRRGQPASARAASSASACRMGEGCVLHPNVTVYDNVDIGRGSDSALGLRDRRRRLRLRDGARALAQVSAGGARRDRRTSSRSAPIRAWTARRWA